MEGAGERFEVSPLTKVKRLPKRGHYEKDTIYSILDEGYICHVGFSIDGQPYVMPTGYGRKGDFIYLHGKSSSHMLKHLVSGAPVCITVTLVDSFVLARSIFHHSMNYRSVVIFGNAVEITDHEEKVEAMRIFSDHVLPGRWDDARLPNPSEIKGTKMVKIELLDGKVSAKTREGPPGDDKEDLDLPIWSGLVPLETVTKPVIPDPTMTKDLPVPSYITNYERFKPATDPKTGHNPNKLNS